MSVKVLTLFGEDYEPEQKKDAGIIDVPAGNAIKKAKTTIRKAEKPLTETIAPETSETGKQYYSIGEVAAIFNVRTSHIRFWTNEFALKVRTTRKGDRLYAPDQIKELKVIYNLVKEQGYTISGAKARLKANKKTALDNIDLKTALTELKNKLLTIRNQIT